MKMRLAALAGAALISGAAFADDAAMDSPALKALEKQGLRIHGPLTVPGGLKAFAASAGSQPLGVYVLPDSNYAIVGTLVDATGNNVAAAALQKAVGETLANEAWKKLENARWVGDGNPNASRVVYVFTDPNCPFCHRFWLAARPWVESGKVQLRHVMVGMLKADSPAKAAAILQAKSPEEALALNETRHEKGGITPARNIGSKSAADLKQNLQLMSDLDFSGTPGIVFKEADGSIGMRAGMPHEADLPLLLGAR